LKGLRSTARHRSKLREGGRERGREGGREGEREDGGGGAYQTKGERTGLILFLARDDRTDTLDRAKT